MAPFWNEEVWGVAGIQGGQHVRMGADVGTGVLHTQRHQGLLASLQEIGAGVKRETEGTHSADTLVLKLQPGKQEERKILLFKLPSVWHFVTAALGN